MHWSAKVLCWVVAMSLQSGSLVVLQRLLRGGDQRPRGGRERETSMQIRRQSHPNPPGPEEDVRIPVFAKKKPSVHVHGLIEEATPHPQFQCWPCEVSARVCEKKAVLCTTIFPSFAQH